MDKEVVLGILSFMSGTAAAFIQSGSPVFGLLFAITSLILLVMLLIFLVVPKFLKRKISVDKHPFWVRIDYYLKYKIPGLNLSDELRTKLFKKALSIKFKAIHDLTKRAMSKKDFSTTKARHLLLDIVAEYEKQWKLHNIPKIFIDKFNYFHAPRVGSIIHYIEFICTSSFHPSLNDKKVAILDGLQLLLNWTFVDIERADTAVNGALTTLLHEMNKNGKL